MTCRRDFSWPGNRRSIRPAMMAQVRKVRFISADLASQASRSSPSMSSSNSASSDSRRAGCGAPRRRGPRPPAHIRWRRSPAASAARAPAAASAACRASGARAALERITDEIKSSRRAERSRSADRRSPGTIERHCWMRSHRGPARGSCAPLLSDRPASGGRGRRDRSRAETCRPRRPAPWDLRTSSARHRPRSRPAPRIRRISPANTKVSPGTSISMKYSSTSPSTRPPRAIGPVWPLPVARERTRRTFSMSASTMVPTFMR